MCFPRSICAAFAATRPRVLSDASITYHLRSTVSFFCCLFCYFFCLGGLWFRLIFSFEEKEKAKYELECCNCGDYCEVDDECCIVYCHDNNLVFGCCCCDENSCCKNNYCKDHCNDINIGRFFCFTDKISFK